MGLFRSILRQFARVTTLPLTGGARRGSLFYILYFIFILSFACACANIGSPDGGPFDETPPRVIKSYPDNQAVNANRRNIRINFNEYIKIENASEKVVVSPPQSEVPNVRAIGKHVSIELFDTLRPNTTYTIDFADAIVDNNEGNPMGNYTFSFSTGDAIDTMEVSGYALNAADLEPVKGILVGLYLVGEDGTVPDSVFRTRPFDRVARTNGSGRFVIKGVASGQRYRAFALQDMDGNFRFTQKNEAIGIDTAIFDVFARPDFRLDTIWRDSTHYDSIHPVRYTHFFPDDIVLRTFLEEGQERHRLKELREVPDHFTMFFTAPGDSMPYIRGLSFEGDGGFIVEPSEKLDTITYWIPDTTIAYADTLAFEFYFQEHDTLGQLVWHMDTVELIPKTTRAKQLKELQRKTEEWEKEQKKKRKQYPNLPPEENPHLITFLSANKTLGANQDIELLRVEELLSEVVRIEGATNCWPTGSPDSSTASRSTAPPWLAPSDTPTNPSSRTCASVRKKSSAPSSSTSSSPTLASSCNSSTPATSPSPPSAPTPKDVPSSTTSSPAPTTSAASSIATATASGPPATTMPASRPKRPSTSRNLST